MQEQTRPPKFLENTVLVTAAIIAHAPLYYQLPRWANGLDPTFVHPLWIAHSSFPFVLHMSRVHPVFWICIVALLFVRICWNYGWRLRK